MTLGVLCRGPIEEGLLLIYNFDPCVISPIPHTSSPLLALIQRAVKLLMNQHRVILISPINIRDVQSKESFLTLGPADRQGRLDTRKSSPEAARRPGHMMYSAQWRSRPGLFARGSTSIGRFPPT